MLLNRRSFLAGAAAAVPVVSQGEVSIPNQRSKEDELREFIQLARKNTGSFFEYDGWRYLFTGWKGNVYSIDLFHQWAAAPIESFGPFEGGGHAFYISMPGRWGLLGRGEAIDISCQWHQVGYGTDLVNSGNHAKIQAELDAAVVVTARAMLECTHGACDWVKDPYLKNRWASSLIMEKASWQTQFLLHPGEYARSLGIKAEEGDHFYQQSMELKRRLYGVEC